MWFCWWRFHAKWHFFLLPLILLDVSEFAFILNYLTEFLFLFSDIQVVERRRNVSACSHRKRSMRVYHTVSQTHWVSNQSAAGTNRFLTTPQTLRLHALNHMVQQYHAIRLQCVLIINDFLWSKEIDAAERVGFFSNFRGGLLLSGVLAGNIKKKNWCWKTIP